MNDMSRPDLEEPVVPASEAAKADASTAGAAEADVASPDAAKAKVSGDRREGTQPSKENEPKVVYIDDAEFMDGLRQLKRLRTFLIKEAVPLNGEQAQLASFGRLNLIRRNFNGYEQPPTVSQWRELESRQELLFQLLSEPLRKKFLRGNIPTWVAVVPALFAVVAAVSLMISVPSEATQATRLEAYLMWIVSTGAIGSIAFIGMNALSVQDDATFDLNNSKLMALRVVLGVMFALILSLPFGFSYYLQFLGGLAAPKPTEENPSLAAVQAVFLLLPFILGFSTSLVIMVLNRLVAAIETFFGRNATVFTVKNGEPEQPNASTSGARTNLPG